jgi:hypothetical protein
LELCFELKSELIPLTEIENFYYDYNPLAHENAFERFIGVVVQAKGAFE